MLWWSRPQQRQRWGNSYVLPSGCWGQIFFDLFYVGGAYNLGNVLKTSSYDDLPRSILYFCGAGFSVMMMWFDKMYYDARFTTRPGHDVFHRVLEVLQICFVATALSRIRSVAVMSNLCQQGEMLGFSLALLLNSCVAVGRYVEVFYHGTGDPSARRAARRDMKWRAIPAICYFAAAIESGHFYFGQNDDYCSIDRPVYYCLMGWLSFVVVGYFDFVVWAPKQRLVEVSVPINVHFCIHRYGEWFMLMFGESIMSLLIVEGSNESTNYNVVFYSGLLSVICLAHMHYGMEPHVPDAHALSRSRHSAFLYTMIVPIYSAALIAVGVSYKMFLYEFTYQDGGDVKGQRDRRYLGEEQIYYDDYQQKNMAYDDTDYKEKRQQFAANLFSGSVVAALVCSDFLQVLHHGLEKILKQLKENASKASDRNECLAKERENAGDAATSTSISGTSDVCADSLKQMYRGILSALERARENVVKQPFAIEAIFLTLRYLSILLLALLSKWTNDPHAVAFCGLGAILVQEFLWHLISRRSKKQGDNHLKVSPPPGKGGISCDDPIPSLASSYLQGSFNERKCVAMVALFEREELEDDNLTELLSENESTVGSTIILEKEEEGIEEEEDRNGTQYTQMVEI